LNRERVNALHPKLHFTIETEKGSKHHYLDIMLQKTPVGIKTAIHRNHTFTDTIIPFTSNHPPAQKFRAIRHMYNWLETYKLDQEEHDRELQTIHNIMHNNSFPIPLHKPRSHTPRERSNTNPGQKWAVFKYICKETTNITNIFRHTDLRISFRTTNTIGNILTMKKQHPGGRWAQSGVYKLTCPDCDMTYMLDELDGSLRPVITNVRLIFTRTTIAQASRNT
jgi:hypothetical protein